MDPAVVIASSAAAVAVIGAFGLLALREGLRHRDAGWLAALAVSVAALELATGPLAGTVPTPVRAVLVAIGTANVALLWCTCLVLLRDAPPSAAHVACMVPLVLGPASVVLDVGEGNGAAAAAVTAIVAALPYAALAHLAFVAWARRRDDGDPRRHRRRRRRLACVLMAAAFVSVASEELSDPAIASMLRTLGAALPAALVALLLVARLDAERLGGIARTPVGVPPAGTAALDPRDLGLHRALRHAMEEERVWLQPGLTLDSLASRLSTPPHRLRALINDGLGHRNFAAYVNAHRLAYARAALADPARGRETVLAIAYESGFASLQTFNRVFRDAEGATPTEFRRRSLARAAERSGR